MSGEQIVRAWESEFCRCEGPDDIVDGIPRGGGACALHRVLYHKGQTATDILVARLKELTIPCSHRDAYKVLDGDSWCPDCGDLYELVSQWWVRHHGSEARS